MRRAPTAAETRLWGWLRNRRHSAVKFRRQVPIGRYIVDFYCAELKLAIELDGSQHQAEWMADYESARTAFLTDRGVRILRIPNDVLIRDSILAGEWITGVIAEMLPARCGEMPPHPPAAPSPPSPGEKDVDTGDSGQK